MRTTALLIALTALAACSSSIDSESVKSPMSAEEALDIATATKVDETIVAAATAGTPSEDAVCNHGAIDEARSFIICEDGALRKAGVVAALSAPVDPELKIEDVAETYDVAPQTFTGIESATYGTLINSERQLPRPRGKSKAQTNLVQIEDKVYEVYQLATETKTGTIFVEQKFDEPAVPAFPVE